jgi:hypothetical protein
VLAVPRSDVLGLLRAVFSALTVAMRFEPANARFFATEIRYSSLKESVRLLGCFSPRTHLDAYTLTPRTDSPFLQYFYSLDDHK